ncbi:MAG: hypothetical protein KKA36_05570 [Gammaproteobacteria bacterium]|nr:hypothetical protein [Gammaproteobacteria bacterium]MBU2478540.1 hypothetical protein [Gammaproteobacteria bacterium]
MRLFIAAVFLVSLGGCSMPKHLEYEMQEVKSNAIIVIDNRPADGKLFRERVDSDVSYFYGDDSFDVSLIEILRNHLAANYPSQEQSIEITINEITLAASINGGGIDAGI